MELTPAAYWLNTALAGFDQSVTGAVHQLYLSAGGFFTPFFKLISLLGKGGIFLIILSICLMLYKKTRRYGTAMAFGLAIGFIIANLFLKVVIARPRPYADEASYFYPLWDMLGRAMESDKSFPSGHTNAAFAACVPVFLLGNKKYSWTALLFGVLMGISRIYLVVHFPSDVVGGLLTGTLAGYLGTMVAMRSVPKIWYERDFFEWAKRPGKHDSTVDT